MTAHDDHHFIKKSLESESTAKQKPLPKGHFKHRSRSDRELLLPREQIAKNLKAIYQNQDGTLPDMKHFEKSRRIRVLRVFSRLLLVGVLSVCLAFVLMYFWNSKNMSGTDAVVLVSGKEMVQIGESVTWRVRYRNTEAVPLSQAVLAVHYPNGFVFEKSSLEPTSESKDEWKIGTIAPNQEGWLDITGRLYGSLGEKQSIRVFFNYLPANFSSEFQKIATFVSILEKSPVSISLSAPEQVTFGSTVPIDITITQVEGFHLPVLFLSLEGSGNFFKKSSEPTSDQVSDTVWTLKGEPITRLKIQGTFLPPEGIATSTPLTLRVFGYLTPQKTGNPIILFETTYAPTFLHTALEAKLVVNGALSEANVAPGESLSTSVALKNTGQANIKNIELSLTFDAPAINKQSILNWREVQDAHNGTITGKSVSEERRQGVITWNSRSIPELKVLAPGSEVRVDVVVPIKKNPEEAEKYSVWDILATGEARYEIETEKKTLTSNTVSLTLNSDTSLEVRNEMSGEKNEIHTVTWLLGNTYHPLKDIQLSAEIYGDTEFDGAKLTVPAGTATYDSEKKTLLWKIPEMPLGIDVHALQFTLLTKTQNPTQTQLTSKVKVKATDTVTQKEIILAGDEVLANVPRTAEE